MLQRARVARLGLLDDRDRPRVLPVTYALWGGALWSVIDDKPKRGEPARIRYLRRRPEAVLTVDRYEDDWSSLAWVQVLGIMHVLDIGASEEALEALAEKYPQYRDRRPPGPLLRLDPERSLCWRASEGSG